MLSRLTTFLSVLIFLIDSGGFLIQLQFLERPIACLQLPLRFTYHSGGDLKLKSVNRKFCKVIVALEITLRFFDRKQRSELLLIFKKLFQTSDYTSPK